MLVFYKSSRIASNRYGDVHNVRTCCEKWWTVIQLFQEITIVDQPLTSIHPDAFEKLYQVQHFFISRCSLQNMSSLSWLQHIRESLVFFSISIENNTHLDMYTTAFSSDFPKLEHLTLVNNGLKEVPNVSLVVDTLRSLYLLRNIYNIRFSELQTLELQTNRIRLISIDKLEMPQLTSLLLY